MLVGFAMMLLASCAGATAQPDRPASPAEGSEADDGPVVTIPLADRYGAPGTVAVGEGAVWVSSSSGEVLRIDPATNEVAAIPARGGVRVGEGAVWACLFTTDENGHSVQRRVTRIDPATNEVVAHIDLQTINDISPFESMSDISRFAVGEGAVWMTHGFSSSTSGGVSRIDPATNEVVATIQVAELFEHGEQWLAAGEGAVWVANTHEGVSRIDPATNEVVATIDVSVGGGAGVATGEGAVWVKTLEGVFRIDPATNEVVATIDVGPDPRVEVAVGEGAVWVANTHEGVSRIDPATNEVVATVPVDTASRDVQIDSVAVGEGAVWVTYYEVIDEGPYQENHGESFLARIDLTAFSG